MAGTYTDKWNLYLPDADSTNWGDEINSNFRTISEHLGGRLSELMDVKFADMPQNGDAFKYDAATETWINCRANEIGVKSHSQLADLTNDDHHIYVRLNGTLPLTGDLDLNYHRVINSLDPVNPSDLITKRYFDEANIPVLASSFVISRGINNPQTILQYEDGDAYIIGTDPVGDWAGHANGLVFWVGYRWVFQTPLREGKVVYVQSEHAYFQYNGATWGPQVNQMLHSELGGLDEGDDHPQYLNEIRHNKLSCHELGVNVPFGALLTLQDVHVNEVSLADGDFLIYKAVPNASGYWINLKSTSVGKQKHNQLWGRLDDANETDPALGGTYTPKPIYDPNSDDYDPSLKCHPQYMTFLEHECDPHEFLNTKYIPFTSVVGYSAILDKALRIGGNLEIKRSNEAGKLTLTTDTLTTNNTVTIPNLSGKVMLLTGSPITGGIPLGSADGSYSMMNGGPLNTVLVSNGPNLPPTWKTVTASGLQANADWNATSGAAMILNKPREFVFVSTTAPSNPQAGDVWVDISL